MELTWQQLIPLVHNALAVNTDSLDRLRFSRFTEQQIADYGLDDERFPVRCRASANVTLDFVTDSAWLALEYDLQSASSWPWYGLDLFVDGVLCDARFRETGDSDGALFELPGGMHRITVFMPWSAEIMLRCAALEDRAVFGPVPQKKHRILALGDSITQGYIAKHPGLTWVGRVTRDLDAEVLNLGVGGYGFRLNSLRQPIGWQPDLIILAYGTNDYRLRETADEYREYVSRYMDRLTGLFPGVPVLMTLPVFRHDEKHLCRERRRCYTLDDARQILRETAGRYSAVTVMEAGHFPHTADFFAPDYLHPNDMGFLVHGEEVVRAARDLLA